MRVLLTVCVLAAIILSVVVVSAVDININRNRARRNSAGHRIRRPPSNQQHPMHRSRARTSQTVTSTIVDPSAYGANEEHAPPNRNAQDEAHVLDAINHRHIHRPPSHLLDGISMSATPSVLEKSGEWVTLEISGVSNPKKDDWIGVYSPATADIKRTKPVKYLMCSKLGPQYLSSGSGSWSFRLLNLRSDYAFVLYHGGLDKPVYAGSSNTVSFLNINEPLGAHLSVTHAGSSEMALLWNSGIAGSAARVQWGTQPGVYTHSAPATSTTYTAADMCGAPANAEGWLPQGPGYFQTAIMTGLTPNTVYYYIFGDDSPGAGGWCDRERRFVSSPEQNEAESRFTLFAFGDLGQDQLDGTLNWSDGTDFQPSRNTTESMYQSFEASGDGAYAMVLHIGDIAYARGYASEWNNFFDQIAPLSDALPWLVTDGNHERDFPGSGSLWPGTDSGGECGVPYAHRFAMPITTTQPGMTDVGDISDEQEELESLLVTRRHRRTGVVHDKPWWSYNFGSIHFVIMSTEHAFDSSSEQYAFLESDLMSVNRSATPWVIFAGHRPMYIDSTNNDPPAGDQPVARLLRAEVEPLLYRYDVDLALWGHHHSYQRTCRVFNETCLSAATDAPPDLSDIVNADSTPSAASAAMIESAEQVATANLMSAEPSLVSAAAQHRGTVHMVIGMAGAGLSTNLDPIPPDWIEVVNCAFYGYITIDVSPDRLRITSIQSIGSKVMDQFDLKH